MAGPPAWVSAQVPIAGLARSQLELIVPVHATDLVTPKETALLGDLPASLAMAIPIGAPEAREAVLLTPAELEEVVRVAHAGFTAKPGGGGAVFRQRQAEPAEEGPQTPAPPGDNQHTPPTQRHARWGAPRQPLASAPTPPG